METKFHDPGTFGGFGKREQTYRQTRFMFYKYRLVNFGFQATGHNDIWVERTLHHKKMLTFGIF